MNNKILAIVTTFLYGPSETNRMHVPDLHKSYHFVINFILNVNLHIQNTEVSQK
jgi:hypothetical protein